ncbi:hypothetical protein GCM10028778_01730 [Barrientosiimonas marina]|uniref:YppG family protein n=1 Tax=Lentibacillus kimchii TaxID=1542911 RepID=A0ABW2UP18_9BACI
MINSGRPGPPVPMPHGAMHKPEPPVPYPSKPSTTQLILKQFQDQDGNMDIDKITTVAQQVGQLYGQISPLITKFTKR